MNIKNKSAKSAVRFGDINIGTVFMSVSGSTSHFMKTEVVTDRYGNKCEAVKLENGIVVLVDDDTPVYVIDCTLVCE